MCTLLTDYTTALQLQINCLKECCQKLKEERDAAKIDYAVAEGMYIHIITIVYVH